MATDREVNFDININTNQSTLDQSVSGLGRLQDATDANLQALAGLRAQALQWLQDLNNVTSAEQQLLDIHNEISNAEQALADGFNSASSAAEQTAQAITNTDDVLKQYMADVAQASQEQADLSGAGAFGAGGAGGDDGGSLYGVARGLRAGAGIGRIAGVGGATTTAFTGAADILYLQQAFDKLGDVIPSVGKALDGMGSQLIDAVPAFGAIGVGASGMVAALAPIAAVMAAAAAGVALFNEEVKAGKAALDEAISHTDAFYKAIQEGTSASLGAELAKLNDQKSAQQEELALDQANYDRQHKALTAQEDDLDLIALEHSALADNINKLKAEIPTTQGQMEGLSDAIKSAGVAANDAAEAARKEAANHIQQQQQLDADDKASVKSDQDRVQALYQQIDAQQGSIAVIQNTNANLDKQGEQYLKNQQAIEAYNAEITKEQDEITHITSISEVYAQKREDAAAADTQFLKNLDDISTANKRADADAKLTAEANLQKQADLKKERDTTQEAITALQQHGVATDADQKKLDDLTKQLQSFDEEINNLQGDVEAARQRQVEADRLKDQQQALAEVIKAEDNYTKSIQGARDTLTNATSDLFLKERTGEEQYQPGSIQDTFARESIAQKEQRDAEKVQLETAQKISDIHTKMGAEQLKITTDYNRQIYDDEVKYGQDRAKLVLDEQRQEQADSIDEANKLADIRHQSQLNEEDDIANRDFAKLARDQRTAADKVTQEETNFTQTENKQRLHLQQQEQDLATSLANQEAKQKTEEGRKIADAETAADAQVKQAEDTEQRKIDALKTSEQQQLDDLSRTENEKLTLMRVAAYQQYEMLVVQENQREQLAQQTETQIVTQANAVLNQATNNYIDDLNRLNAMASGTSGGSTAPLTAPAGAGSYSSPSAPTVDVGSAVHNVIQGFQDGLSTMFSNFLAG